MSEFNLIQQYFTRPTPHADLGVGDDAALIRVREGYQLAVSTDMLVSGTHFFADAAPYDIGWKALAVNISDMAAMSAQPKWATLALALPEVNETWLAEFSRGFFACADAFKVSLIGGDTTRGPLNISVTIMGEVATGQALRRDGAKIGDDIWVSGTLGDAALALNLLQQTYTLDKHWPEDELSKWLPALHRPQPRIALGLGLIGLANGAIDISDGLLADLGHILSASNVSATLYFNHLSINLYLHNHANEPAVQHMILAGGDDYELCFTAPQANRSAIEKIGKDLHLTLSLAGSIHAGAGHACVVLNERKQAMAINKTGFDHFA